MQEQDVVDMLLQQHEQIKDLFRRVAAAQGAEKRDLFQDLVRLLAVHESAEEEIVHPAARREIVGGGEMVDMRLHEENEAKHALADLYDKGVEDPQFNSMLGKLAEAVTKHAEQEEHEEFARLRQSVSGARLRRMAGAFKAAEAAAPTRPHPMVGESQAANWLVGPPLGVFDRIRDIMRDWRESNTGD